MLALALILWNIMMVNATLICKFHCDLMDTGGGVGKLQGKSVECSYRSPKTIDRFFCVHGVLYPSDYNTGANHEMIQRHNQQLKEELSNVRGKHGLWAEIFWVPFFLLAIKIYAQHSFQNDCLSDFWTYRPSLGIGYFFKDFMPAWSWYWALLNIFMSPWSSHLRFNMDCCRAGSFLSW